MASRNLLCVLVLGPCLVALAACSGDESLAGVGNKPRSQVVVQRTIPLTVPPGYGERPGEDEAEIVAEGTVIDERDTSSPVVVASLNATMGEQVLLQRSGAMEADPLVRAKLNRENALLVGKPEFVEALLFGTYPAGGVVEVMEGEYEVSDIDIEQADDEDTWLDEAWDSLGQ